MSTHATLSAIARAANVLRELPKVYPAYIAFQIKKALKAGDPEGIIDVESIGDIETIGDCRYAIRVSDDSGTSYRITVEVSA